MVDSHLKQRKLSVVTDLPPTLRTVRSELLKLRKEKLYDTKEWSKARIKQLPRFSFLKLVITEAAPAGAQRHHREIEHRHREQQLAAA